MSVSKKSTAKSTKSPAPATKPAVAVKPVPAKPIAVKPVVAKPAPAKTPAKKVKQATPVVPALKATPVAEVAPAPVTKPVVKAVEPRPVLTTIAARVDVGFGNFLYIRGEGTGLSWDKGTAMDCVGADLWQIVISESVRPVTFKFLVNDLSWSTGPDYSVPAGTTVMLTPEF